MKPLPWQIHYLIHLKPELADKSWYVLRQVFKKTDFKSRRARDFEAGWRAAWIPANEHINKLLDEVFKGRSPGV